MALNEQDKLLLLGALGSKEVADRIVEILNIAASGNVTGPTSSTDNALVRFNGLTGAVLQNSGVLLDNSNNLSGLGSINLSGQIDVPITAVGAPSYSFSGNLNTGMTSTGADTLNFSTGGIEGLNISSVQDVSIISGHLNISTSGKTLRNQLGTVTLPSYTFSGDTNTGIYSSAADTINFATNGGNRGSVNSSGNWTFGTAGTSSTHIFNGTTISIAPSVAGIVTFATNTTNSATRLVGNGGGTLTGYGSTHATKASQIEFSQNGGTTISGSISSVGLWTIGASGGTQIHTINSDTAATNTGVLTLTNGPGVSTGNPTVYLKLNINGTTYAIPAWVF